MTTFQERIASGKRLVIAEISPPQGRRSRSGASNGEAFCRQGSRLGCQRQPRTGSHGGVGGRGPGGRRGDRADPPRNHAGPQSHRADFRGAGGSGPGHPQRALHQRRPPNAGPLPRRSKRLRRRLGAARASLRPVGRRRLGCEREGDRRGPARSAWARSPRPTPIRWPLQITRLAKKVKAGAAFLVTQPIYDLERFHAWWKAVTDRGIDKQVAILAGIEALPEGTAAAAKESAKNGSPSLARVPQSVLHRIESAASPAARRAAAIEIAVETIKQLSTVSGLRGFGIACDGDCDAALEILDRSGLGSN